MTSANLFNGVESSSKSRNVGLVFDVELPWCVGQTTALRPEHEKSEVTVGHVVVLGV